MRFRLSTRQLITAGLYGVSATLAVTSLVLSAGSLSSLDLTLSLCGVIPWGMAAAQSVYRKYHARRNDVNAEKNPPLPSSQDKLAIRGSTHSTINALLNVISATSFLAGDLCHVTAVTPAMRARLIGSSLWLTSSGLYCWLAKTHERRQEEVSDLAVQSKKTSAAKFHFMGEIGFLGAGALYYAAWWLDPTRAPLKLIGYTCWLTAGSHDTLQAAWAIKSEKQKPPVRIDLVGQYHPPLFSSVHAQLPAPTITIEVVNDKKISPEPMPIKSAYAI